MSYALGPMKDTRDLVSSTRQAIIKASDKYISIEQICSIALILIRIWTWYVNSAWSINISANDM